MESNIHISTLFSQIPYTWMFTQTYLIKMYKVALSSSKIISSVEFSLFSNSEPSRSNSCLTDNESAEPGARNS